MLDEVGIGAERRLRLRQFSKGMMQRVGLAQALLNDPEVVFLDEPMSGLDPLGRRHVRDLILRLRDRGCTVFFSSHILSDAEALCSRVAHRGAGPAGRQRAGCRDMLAFELQGMGAGGRRRVGRDALARWRRASRSMTALAHGRYTIELPPDAEPDELLDELRRAGAQIESLNPVRETLEDFFVQRCGAAATAADRAVSMRTIALVAGAVFRNRSATACRTRWWCSRRC